MVHKKVHRAIKKVFRHRTLTDDNMPIGSGRRFQRNLFPKLFANLNFNIGAEIGVRTGAYSRKFCKANPNLTMYCIDPWIPYTPSITDVYKRYSVERQNEIYDKAVRNLAHYNTIIIRKTSMEALNDFEDGQLDFVYIDGDHTFDHACLDIIFWSQKVKSGGIIACHDYHAGTWSGVVPAIDAYVQSHSISPWYVTKEKQPTAYWVNP